MKNSFFPPERVLLGPGPSMLHPKVQAATAKPLIGHLDPLFQELMESLKDLLRYAFCTKNEVTFPLSAPASAGMEFCLMNFLRKGDEVIVGQNGVFSKRMLNILDRLEVKAISVDHEWGRAIDPQRIEDAFRKNTKAKHLLFVHAETSTGALSDAEALAKMAHKFDALTIVDTVTSLGGSPLEVDKWGLDICYSGTQKCLSSVPGVSPITLSQRALERLPKKGKMLSWFLDLELILEYWKKTDTPRSYHHTAPINNLYALHEALVLVKEEGLEKRIQRTKRLHSFFAEKIAKLRSLDLKFFVPKGERIPQLNTLLIPQAIESSFGISESEIRQRLLNTYNIEIGGGLGPLASKVWRVGLMGHSMSEKNIIYLIGALEDLFSR